MEGRPEQDVLKRPATEAEEAYLSSLEEEANIALEHLVEHFQEPDYDVWRQEAEAMLDGHPHCQANNSPCDEMLRKGAELVNSPWLLRTMGYDSLRRIKEAARTLQQVVDDAMLYAWEKERRDMSIRYGQAEEKAKLMERKYKEAREETTSMHAKFDDIKEQTLCIICFSKDRDAIILPCLHFNACNECLGKLRQRNWTCPTCRAPISGVLQCCFGRS